MSAFAVSFLSIPMSQIVEKGYNLASFRPQFGGIDLQGRSRHVIVAGQSGVRTSTFCTTLRYNLQTLYNLQGSQCDKKEQCSRSCLQSSARPRRRADTREKSARRKGRGRCCSRGRRHARQPRVEEGVREGETHALRGRAVVWEERGRTVRSHSVSTPEQR